MGRRVAEVDLKLLAPFFGYALFLVWFSQAEVVVSGLETAMEMLIVTSMARYVDLGLLVLVSCLSSLIGTLRGRLPVVAALGVVMAAASLLHLAVASGVLPGSAPAALAGAFIGLGRAGGALVWMEAFSSVPYRRTCIAFPLVSFAGIGLRQVVGLAPPVPACALWVLCAAASMALVRCSTVDGTAECAEEDGRWTFPFKPIVLMGMYAFAYSLVLNAIPPTAFPPFSSALGDFLVCAGVLVAAIVTGGLLNIKMLYGIALPCVATALLLSLSCFSSLSAGTPLFGSVGFFAFSMFTNLLLMNISYRYGVNPLWLFGFARAARVVGTAAAAALLGSAAEELLSYDVAAAVALVALIVVSSSLLTAKDYATTWGMTPVDDRAADRSVGAPTEADVYARLSRRYGLTRREEEVLILLGAGARTADIERELVISNGTARNHIQHIYKKLDLRSREQVRAFIAEELNDVSVRDTRRTC